MTPIKNRRSGVLLVEFAYIFPVAAAVLSLCALMGTRLVARALIGTDVYALARSHLYGSETARCSLSSWWPQGSLTSEVQCSGDGKVTAALLWKGKNFSARTVDLRSLEGI